MKRPPASLGFRLLLGASAVVVVALVATGIMMSLALHHFIQGQVDGRLDGQLNAVEDALRVGPGRGLTLERVVDGPPFDRPYSGWYWEVLAPDPVLRSRSLAGHSVALGDALQDRPPGLRHGPDPDPIPDPGRRPQTFAGTGPPDEPLRLRVRDVRVGPVVATIVAAAPREALDGPLRDAMTPLAVTLALLAVLLVGGGLVQVRLGLRPLRKITADLARVRTGRAERIAGPQPTEIRPLVGELNSLLDQHAANLERARRNVANLAHSLKTPLATLGVALDESGRDPDRRLAPLVATMDRMIRHHLARARTAALDGPARTRVSLGPRVADHRAAFARLYADKGLAIADGVPDGLWVACEAQDLDEMLGNLLDNACKWARGRIAVGAEARGTRLAITIADDGPGLTGTEAVEVLRPGRRIDESAPGYGFGLTITRELAELYGGALTLERAALGGLLARLDLPRAG